MKVNGFLLQDETGQEYLVNLHALPGSKLVSFIIQYRAQGAWKTVNKRSATYPSMQAKAMAALMTFSFHVGNGTVVLTTPSSEDRPSK